MSKRMKTPRGTARAARRHHLQYPQITVVKVRPTHEWDDDACCIHCGFDGAEAAHLHGLGYGEESSGYYSLCTRRPS